MNREDYREGMISMPCPGLTTDDIRQFYPVKKQDDMGLQDIILRVV